LTFDALLLLPPPPLLLLLLLLLLPLLLLTLHQVLESQLQARRQHELELEQQVAELTARVSELSGQVNSAEVANKQSSHLERQVGVGEPGGQGGR
jgi:CHASE1-domain containing sensor protein